MRLFLIGLALLFAFASLGCLEFSAKDSSEGEGEQIATPSEPVDEGQGELTQELNSSDSQLEEVVGTLDDLDEVAAPDLGIEEEEFAIPS